MNNNKHDNNNNEGAHDRTHPPRSSRMLEMVELQLQQHRSEVSGDGY